MFKNIDVIFWVEHKDRELDSYETIAKLLKEKYGLKSIIISNFFHSHYLWIYKPKLVIWNNLSNNIGWPDGFMWDTYNKNIVYISHRWEQMLTPVGEKFKKPNIGFETDIVKFFVWNKYFKNYLIKNRVKKENVFLVGKLSNNLLLNMKDKNIYYKDILSKELNIDKNKKWIFCPMNYSWFFRNDEKIEEMIQRGYDSKKAYELKEFTDKSLYKFIEFVKELSKLDYEIIIRSHPSITEEECEQFFVKNIENIHITKAHSVKEWIVASDFVISSWSTTMYDSYSIGKKTFMFEPYKTPIWFENPSLSHITRIKSVEDFKNNLNIKLEEVQLDSNSIEMFSQSIKELIPKSNTKIVKFNFKYIKNFFKYWLKNMLCKYFKCFGIPKWQHYDWFEMKEF